MKTTVLFLILALTTGKSFSQSAAIYLCNNCTYKNTADGQTITFNKNGTVKINGILKPGFTCKNNDGTVELYYKKKLVNKLEFNSGGKRAECSLIDQRNYCYSLINCNGKK